MNGAPSSKLPWRAVGLSALIGVGVASAALSVVAAKTGGFVLRNDGAAYFLYARALVLQGDTDPTDGYRLLDARFPPDPEGPLAALRWSARRMPDGGRIALPWPVGAGLAMAPFYAAGWGAECLAARRAGRAPDSFGWLPQYAYGLGAVAWGLLGFWATFLACRRVAGPGAAAAASLALLLAGPAAFYIFLHPTMAHAPSLGLAALLVLLWWRQWDAGKVGPAALAGLSALLGLLVLIRYQNIVFAALPAALVTRIAWGRRLPAAAVAVLACAAPLAIEVAHLRETGELAAARAHLAGRSAAGEGAGRHRDGAPAAEVNGMAPLGEGGAPAGAPPGRRGGVVVAQNRFDAASPHFFDVLLSCQHGAFYWTPVLGLGAAALGWAALRHGWARALGVVLLADVYLIGCLSSGTNWSGDNAFGMRYLVESVPLLGPPLALLLAARPAALRLWAPALALLVLANGLLMLAFAFRTISHSGCVTYREMAAGILRALPASLAGGSG